jgi:Domain of unknown function (DUF4157)
MSSHSYQQTKQREGVASVNAPGKDANQKSSAASLQERLSEHSPNLQLKALAASLNARPQVVQLARWQEKLNRNRNPRKRLAGCPCASQCEEEVLQGRFAANTTGLPDSLKSAVESLSGLSMDDVKVHYNSSRPAHLEALAYAQGTDIHVAPGQEQNLPHEAWHVVQQKQGRVQPTMQLQGTAINDDAGLEHEADVMGQEATNHRLLAQTIATAGRKPIHL